MNQELLSIYEKPTNFKNVMKFTLPTIAMALIQSMYTMIDGMFISNIIGSDALSALTLISPYFNIVIAISAMLASGGCALVMKKMGEGKRTEAKEDFTMLLLINIIIGLTFTILGTSFSNKLSSVFGASQIVINYSNEYLFYYCIFMIPHMLFSNLQMYVIASNGSKAAFISSLAGGLTNIVLDFLLIKVFNLGMKGAAIATGLGVLVPCIILFLYFLKNKDLLHFIRPKFRKRTLIKTTTNGMSEMSTNLVGSIVMFIFNSVMLSVAGENGVAASTIIFYVFGFMSALYMGYVYGIAPMFSYFLGSKNHEKMKKLYKISLKFILIISVLTTLASIIFTELLVGIFIDSTLPSYNLAVSGNRLFSIALLLVGFNTFASGLFTALSNGIISAVISISRTFVFLLTGILILPIVLELNGIWLSVPFAEILTILLSIFFLKKYRKRYCY